MAGASARKSHTKIHTSKNVAFGFEPPRATMTDKQLVGLLARYRDVGHSRRLWNDGSSGYVAKLLW